MTLFTKNRACSSRCLWSGLFLSYTVGDLRDGLYKLASKSEVNRYMPNSDLKLQQEVLSSIFIILISIREKAKMLTDYKSSMYKGVYVFYVNRALLCHLGVSACIYRSDSWSSS